MRLKPLSASILILLALLLNAMRVSAGDNTRQDQRDPDNLAAKYPANPNKSPFTIIIQPAPLQVVQANTTMEKNKLAQKWYERPSFTDWGILCVTFLYTLISIGLLNATRKQSVSIKEALITDKRAFMYADGIMSFWESDPTTGLYNWRFRPRWRNAGETPTRDPIIYVQCEVRDQQLPPGFNFQLTKVPSVGHSSDLRLICLAGWSLAVDPRLLLLQKISRVSKRAANSSLYGDG